MAGRQKPHRKVAIGVAPQMLVPAPYGNKNFPPDRKIVGIKQACSRTATAFFSIALLAMRAFAGMSG